MPFSSPKSLIHAAYDMDFAGRSGIGRRPTGRGIGVFGPPKSASTFLVQALVELIGYPVDTVLRIHPDSRALLMNELDFGRTWALTCSINGFLAHAHLQPNPNTLDTLLRLPVQAVVTRRNVADSLVSLSEEWAFQWEATLDRIRDDGYSTQFIGDVPARFVECFLAAAPSERLDMTIDACATWYFQTLAGWDRAAKRAELSNKIWFADFDQIRTEPERLLSDLLRFLALNVAPGAVEATVQQLRASPERTRFNVGARGRSDTMFTADQKERLARQAERWDAEHWAFPPAFVDREAAT